MHEKVIALGSRCTVRLALAGLTAALLAGCSSDVTRFNDNPFSNPFGSASAASDHTPVATIQHPAGKTYAQGTSSAIQSQPLAPPAPVASYSAPAHRNPPLVARAATRPDTDIRTSSTRSWSAEGGTPITVAGGETAGILAVRYGVPIDALLHVNGFRSAGEVHPGTRLVIPVYRVAAAHPQRASEAQHQLAARERTLPTRNIPPQHVARHEPAGSRLHFVKGPQPAKEGTAKMSAAREPRSAHEIHGAKAGERRSAEAERREKLAAQKAAAAKERSARLERPAAAEPKREAAAPRKPAAIDRTATGSLPPAARAVSAAPTSPAAGATPQFRWPAHGRIIQGFKLGGNDGINIAVPEGTAVKAADDGVVAYAGDELKGYGKLVLIRHPNGFVSAYANNESIEVKRGQTVKRGQVIAKSGQTGNVASPQLHFELRKGSTPVDPTRFLAGL